MIILTSTQIIKVILRNILVVRSHQNNLHKVLVKITCLEWVEKDMVSEHLVTETLKYIKWFHYKELTHNEVGAEGELGEQECISFCLFSGLLVFKL